jgi:hypothetical protein
MENDDRKTFNLHLKETIRYFEEFSTFDTVPKEYLARRCIKETMFASHYDEDIERVNQMPESPSS